MQGDDVGTPLPPHPAPTTTRQRRLHYNRDKIVYTCAIVANIRRSGGDDV